MRTIIDNKVYNTETAEEVSCWENCPDTRNHHYICETLYRTPRGNWFFVREGYIIYTEGLGYSFGEVIDAASPEDVVDWANRHRKLRLLETYFPDVLEEA